MLAFFLPGKIIDMSQTSPHRQVISVSELTHETRLLLEKAFPLCWIEGEISNLARPASGHLYFTLKDDKAQVRCAMFRNRSGLLNFQPQNGMQIQVRAKISLYEPRGDFQLIVEHMEEAGHGALQRQFDALKAKLEAEGLFAPERKQPLPPFPKRIGVITSASGAAIRDIISVLRKRFPAIEVIVYPVAVQGTQAAPEIVAALGRAQQRNECDVLIVGRGGGSLEDLWAFNEESVARAIAGCTLPVVSAVGHEIDFSISDFVADVRAATPSAAAEILSPDQNEWLQRLRSMEQRISHLGINQIKQKNDQCQWLRKRLQQQHPGQRIQTQAQRLDELEQRILRSYSKEQQARQHRLEVIQQKLDSKNPGNKIQLYIQSLPGLKQRLVNAQQQQQRHQQQRLQALSQNLHSVSPLAVLGRGYSILQDESGQNIVRSVKQVNPGDRLLAKLGDGQLSCRVDKVKPDKSR